MMNGKLISNNKYLKQGITPPRFDTKSIKLRIVYPLFTRLKRTKQLAY